VSSYRWRSPAVVRRLFRRIGFRGIDLLLLAAVDFAYGLSFVHPSDPGQRIVNGYLAAAIPFDDVALSMWTWAFMWWLTGAFCLVNAFRREDRWGYGMAIALKVGYVTAILYGNQHGMPNGTTRAIVWIFITGWVVAAARRAEPHRDIREVARELEETGDIPRYDGGGEDA
jgi:hypothetical protein